MSLMDNLWRFKRYIRTLGVLKGTYLFFKLAIRKNPNVSIGQIAYPFKLRSNTSDIPTFEQVFIAKEYDFELDFKPSTIIDAGANIGMASIYFANRYPEAKLVAIEPEASNFSLLQQNTQRYGNIITLNKALSNKEDQKLKVVDPGNGHWAFVTQEVESQDDTDNTVDAISIDKILEQLDCEVIDLVKIDIEGHEKKVFENGAKNWLPKTKCLIIEIHDNINMGSSKNFFKAIGNYDFAFSYRGENMIFINNDL